MAIRVPGSSKSSGASTYPHCWRNFDAVIEHVDRVLLYGPSGTGKTIAALTGGVPPDDASMYQVLTEETPAAEIRGVWVPSPEGFVWQDGPAIAAWRAGSRLVLDEIDHASGDVLSLLMAITDGAATARLTLPTRETVRPAPGFTVVATMNGNPDHLPPAIRDRFPVTIEIDAVHPAALAALPEDLRAAATSTALLPPERRLSVRAWLTFAKLRPLVGEQVAAEVVFGRARAADVLDALRLGAA